MAVILVVDDEQDTLEVLRLWLAKHNYEVLTASSGKETLAVALTQQPDLILLDVMMPSLSGIDVCRQLRGREETSHIPVILITAFDPSVGRVEALMAGATDYVTKPIQFADLLDRMRLILVQDEGFRVADRRLVQEVVHGTLAILPCNLAWLLTLDTHQRMLVGQAVATSKGAQGAREFLAHVAPEGGEASIPFDQQNSLLVQAALGGVPVLNAPLSKLRDAGDRLVYDGCAHLNLYFVSIVPFQMAGTPLGVMLLGAREPRDVETTHGQQLLAAIASQAATAIYNNRLMHRLAERERQSTRERIFRQTVLDTMSDGLLVHNAGGSIVFANRRLSSMTGATLDALRGSNVEDLFIPADRERLAPIVRDPLTSQTRTFEVALQRVDGAVLPVLAVQAGRHISQEGDVGDRVMVITDLSRLKTREESLGRYTERLSTMNRATRTIAATRSLDETISAVLAEVGNVIQASLAAVLLRLPDSEELVVHSANGAHAKQLHEARIAAHEGVVVSEAAQQARPVLVSNLHNGNQTPHPFEQLAGVPICSAAAAPLVVDGQVIGVIEVLHEKPGALDEFDLGALEGLARAASTAIGNARLIRETNRSVRELTLLLKTSETASSTLAIGQVVEMVARQLLEALSADWCLVSAWKQQDRQLVHLAEIADMVWPARQSRMIDLRGYPETVQTLEDGQPSILLPASPETGVVHFGEMASSRVKALLLLPIEVDDAPVGLAEVCHLSDQQAFSADDLERCRTTMVAWGKTLGTRQWQTSARLRELSARLLRATDAARCTIYAYDRESSRATLLHQSGAAIWPPERGPAYQLEEGGLRRVALAERTPVLARVGDVQTFSGEQSAFPGADAGAMLIAPLVAHGQAIGLVELLSIDPARQFSESDLSLARAIGSVVGNALENARLYSALGQRAAQLEAAYNDLREADRVKAEWLQNVSHELRTPLTSVIGYVDLMLEGDFGPVTDEQHEGLAVIGSKSRQLARLVNDLLTIQHVKQESLDLTLVSLADIAEASMRALEPVAEKAGIELVADIEDDLPPLLVDSQLILQVFDNLIGNAIKFSPNGGRVAVRVEDIGPAIQAQVSDEGIGIPPSEHQKIWRRFYQVDGGMTRQYGGTGLGLALVKEIVEKHNGRVWVESAPEQGSSFSFLLPKASVSGLPEGALTDWE